MKQHVSETFNRTEVSAKSLLPAFLKQGRNRNPLFLLPSVFCHLSSVGCKITFCTRLRTSNDSEAWHFPDHSA